MDDNINAPPKQNLEASFNNKKDKKARLSVALRANLAKRKTFIRQTKPQKQDGSPQGLPRPDHHPQEEEKEYPQRL